MTFDLRSRLVFTLGIAAGIAAPGLGLGAAPRVESGPRFVLQRLALPTASRTASVAVELDGKRVTLVLEGSTVRAPGFRLMVQDADGALREVPAPAPRTCRGTVREIPGAIVGGTLDRGRLSAAIALPDGRTFYVQPSREEAGSDPSLHVVYPGDAVDAEGSCPVDGAPVPLPPSDLPKAPAAPLQADLVLDSDYELYRFNESSIDSTVQDMENVISGVNVIYERDCNITHRITSMFIRPYADDPYNATEPSAMLDEVRNYFNTYQPGLVRDVVHLMTGKELDGTTIGIAFLGAVCNRSRAYGLSETHWNPNYAGRTALTAHELGHNWNAAHCDQAAQCNIMCSSINQCDGMGLPNFEPMGINAIQAFAASRSCLNSTPASVDNHAATGHLVLASPSPSPFEGATELRFYVERPGPVRLGIYDVTGQRVAGLVDGLLGSGWHTRVWKGLDGKGHRLKPGLFFVRLEAHGESRIQKLSLIR